MADIELEKFMFMKVSEILNKLCDRGEIENILGVAVVLVKNMMISNYESFKAESELNNLRNTLQSQR